MCKKQTFPLYIQLQLKNIFTDMYHSIFNASLKQFLKINIKLWLLLQFLRAAFKRSKLTLITDCKNIRTANMDRHELPGYVHRHKVIRYELQNWSAWRVLCSQSTILHTSRSQSWLFSKFNFDTFTLFWWYVWRLVVFSTLSSSQIELQK